MAVDTRDRRFSMIGLAVPYNRVLPNPDSDFTLVNDRIHLEYLYRGIDPVVIGAPIAPATWFHRRRLN